MQFHGLYSCPCTRTDACMHLRECCALTNPCSAGNSCNVVIEWSCILQCSSIPVQASLFLCSTSRPLFHAQIHLIQASASDHTGCGLWPASCSSLHSSLPAREKPTQYAGTNTYMLKHVRTCACTCTCTCLHMHLQMNLHDTALPVFHSLVPLEQASGAGLNAVRLLLEYRIG